MAVTHFPDPRQAGPEGLVAVGGDFEPITLISAYRQGIFPWPVPQETYAWFSPDPRGVLFFEELHLSRRFREELKKPPFRLSFDEAFPRVIRACAHVPRPGQGGTWITDELVEAYLELHSLGHAHSCEAWDGTRLVGGIYGVEFDGCFAGESMFFSESGASKHALVHLVRHLAAQGAPWMDIQMVTPHLATFGAREIPREDYLQLLARTRDPHRRLFP